MHPDRLNLFGITGAATYERRAWRQCRMSASISLESRVLRQSRPQHEHGMSRRLNLFGITGAATARAREEQADYMPPQSLWNHGCCDDLGRRKLRERPSASISLESRVLRRAIMSKPSRTLNRLNLFGITGAATPRPLRKPPVKVTASISLESRVLRQYVW